MKNKYLIDGDLVYIDLSKRDGTIIKTIISIDDLDLVNSFKGKWYSDWCKSIKGYYVKGNNGKTTIRLHRHIMNPLPGLVIDHINRNTLDNRRINLRSVTQEENLQNVSFNIGNKSNVRGVSWHGVSGKWQARTQIKKKQYHLGIFDDIKEAEQAVIKFRINNGLSV